MWVQNANGTWDLQVNTSDNPNPPVQLFPGFLPNAPSVGEIKSSPSLFDIPYVDEGYNTYQGIGGYYSKAKAQASRLFDSLKTGISNAATGVSNTASSIANFWQSTLWKVMIIVIIAAILFLFGYSFIQAKAGRMANV